MTYRCCLCRAKRWKSGWGLRLLLGSCMPAECRLSGSMLWKPQRKLFYKVVLYHIWMCTICVNIKPEFEVVFEELVEWCSVHACSCGVPVLTAPDFFPQIVLMWSICYSQQADCVGRMLLCSTCSNYLRGNVSSVYVSNPNQSGQNKLLEIKTNFVLVKDKEEFQSFTVCHPTADFWVDVRLNFPLQWWPRWRQPACYYGSRWQVYIKDPISQEIEAVGGVKAKGKCLLGA